MAEVTVHGVSRFFGSHAALQDVSIDFPDGGFYGLLGPSGSGKTTLLRMIAGFDFPDAGAIAIGGEDVAALPVQRRRIGMVFQNYALFPNMSVFDNIAFGLSVRGVARKETRDRVEKAVDLVQLSGLGARRPHQLSGGQRQRVALARAIVTRPQVLLLDEPLSALDKSLRVGMQIELKRIQREVGITTIFVTHDQEEALTMSDRIGILRDGRLEQEGPPAEIYDNPASEFAATFLGDANIFRGTVDGNTIHLADGTCLHCREALPPGTRAACAVRPERIMIRSTAGPVEAAAMNSLPARITKRIFAGNSITYLLNWQGETLKAFAQNTGTTPFDEGAAVTLHWAVESTIPLS
ncbi:ABC transporter ATP-binding protein [Pelagibius litoralis]|uniref:Spermidine/putrescine import ATP-binding protein PotA n=1 Tax=Pelagibius litoralis TaxID=374515 RepID=A0A967F271_9PROT|nr:ABC transporter ATP-binding protein [Pelagibius litoralis]NIA71720.1 ABC transporter ATP-binding protein [Pelagibius litoralis]